MTPETEGGWVLRQIGPTDQAMGAVAAAAVFVLHRTMNHPLGKLLPIFAMAIEAGFADAFGTAGGAGRQHKSTDENPKQSNIDSPLTTHD